MSSTVAGRLIGMGRLLGDGGWYFHVIEMAVLPDHQRCGLGDAVLSALLGCVREHAAAGAYVNLLADPRSPPLRAARLQPDPTRFYRHGKASRRRPRSGGVPVKLSRPGHDPRAGRSGRENARTAC